MPFETRELGTFQEYEGLTQAQRVGDSTDLVFQVQSKLNRSFCDIIQASVPHDAGGLFNFSWFSETSLAFVSLFVLLRPRFARCLC